MQNQVVRQRSKPRRAQGLQARFRPAYARQCFWRSWQCLRWARKRNLLIDLVGTCLTNLNLHSHTGWLRALLPQSGTLASTRFWVMTDQRLPFAEFDISWQTPPLPDFPQQKLPLRARWMENSASNKEFYWNEIVQMMEKRGTWAAEALMPIHQAAIITDADTLV